MNKKKLEAMDIALEKFFKGKRLCNDNFLLDADRDRFIFIGGFKAGCKWMLKNLKGGNKDG